MVGKLFQSLGAQMFLEAFSNFQNKSILQFDTYLTLWQYSFAERALFLPLYLFWHVTEAILFTFSLHFAKKNKASWLSTHKLNSLEEGSP